MSSAIESLHNRIDLTHIPYTDRGSRLLLFRRDDELYIRLAERWIKHEEEVGHYRRRLPILDHFQIVDGDGYPLQLQVESYPHVVRLHTASGNFDWTITDPESILVRLPAGSFGLRFEILADNAQVDTRGGITRGIRNMAYTTNAHITQNVISEPVGSRFKINLRLIASPGDSLLINITPRLAYNRSLPDDPNSAIDEVRRVWDAWFKAAPPVLEEYRTQYYYAWWILRAGLLNQRYYFTREALTPSKIHYVGVWHWDQFFHALAYRHVDTRLAEDQLRIVLDHQRADGMLPDAVHDEGTITHLNFPVDADVTKPPLVGWTALKLFRKSRHLDFLKEVYEPITRWHDWWMRDNSDGDGLCVYRHPFSSGLDDSPLWDYGMPVTSPDLNSYLIMAMVSMARIAELIGRKDDAARHIQSAQAMTQRMTARLWDDQRGLFMARTASDIVPVVTPFSILPFWTGMLPETITQRLIQNLTNPDAFWSGWPLPTVAYNDPTFDPMQMWRGPAWMNINYLFVEGLERVGRNDLAGHLRRKSLDLIMLHNDIYEYYNPLTGEHPPKAAPIFGWTSAVFIDLAIQETRAVENGD
jgi:hypothetical protein